MPGCIVQRSDPVSGQIRCPITGRMTRVQQTGPTRILDTVKTVGDIRHTLQPKSDQAGPQSWARGSHCGHIAGVVVTHARTAMVPPCRTTSPWVPRVDGGHPADRSCRGRQPDSILPDAPRATNEPSWRTAYAVARESVQLRSFRANARSDWIRVSSASRHQSCSACSRYSWVVAERCQMSCSFCFIVYTVCKD